VTVVIPLPSINETLRVSALPEMEILKTADPAEEGKPLTRSFKLPVVNTIGSLSESPDWLFGLILLFGCTSMLRLVRSHDAKKPMIINQYANRIIEPSSRSHKIA
jgi:hypothetical protein